MQKILTMTLVALSMLGIASAQSLPKDPALREGHLANGLSYYIRHNGQTKGHADFYLIHKVGSILEEKDQRGLAHFLEHMAFNGTEHFPGGNTDANSIHSWCEKNGIKFGADLNASTGIEKTMFNISNAPISKPGVVDTCLLILSDWSHSLLLKDDEIDKERNVIHEEWRTRRSSRAIQRLMEDAMSAICKGSKYEDCLPIGSMDVVDNFPYEALRRYYDKWYRPDLQAVVVLGDVDVDDVERKICDLFSKIQMPDNAAERVYYTVGDNEEMLVASIADNEQPTLNMQLFMKREPSPRAERNTREAFAEGYKARLAMFVVRQRLQQIVNVANPAVLSANAHDSHFYLTDSKDAFSVSIGLMPDKPKAGIDAVMEVVMKARRYGITESEFEHAKLQFNVNLEHRVDNKNKTNNNELFAQVINHFCNNEHLMSIEQEADIEHELMDNVTIDEVNAVLRELIFDGETGKNQVALIFGPTMLNGNPYTMPSDDDFKEWILAAEKREYVNDIVNTPIDRQFVKKLPKKGKIVERAEFANGYTKYVLSNGMNVYARPSDIEPNRLTLRLFREGGREMYGDEDVPAMTILGSAITKGGASDFDFLTLEKKRAGKALRVSPFFSDQREGIVGVCAASDFKTWLEVAYLYITQPRRDEAVFASMIERHKEILRNRTASPQVVFNDSLRHTMYLNPQRLAPLTLETIETVTYDRIMEIYKERFSNMAGMSFIVTGDIRMDEFEELICQYVASMPGDKRHPVKTEGAVENRIEMRHGECSTIFEYPQKTPSVRTEITYFADMPYTADNDLRIDVLSQIMRAIYTETVREEIGGTYGVSVSSKGWSKPTSGLSLTVSFGCAPERVDSIIPIIDSKLKQMAEEGPTMKQLQNVKEYERKNFDRVVNSNGWWEFVCYHMLTDNIDLNKSYMERVDMLTPDDIKTICRDILAAKNRLQTTMK